MVAATGYSGTPLPKKLGLKDGQAVAFSGLPAHLADLLRARAYRSVESVGDWTEIIGRDLDYVHLFTDSAATVDAATPALRDRIAPDGMIWMSWPKKASKVPTDVTEDVIRKSALADVLVDVKVCAVDTVWSGLKLVIRKEHRA
ncbi:DUF3052 domain-containing protein [Alphaproteobacteria bacterium GH1-50]|uniref:DUF3052 domain-containing protein n=1 Tax=Kangsaoukella pontilimi TaxID=2691042 RepID=A0A7C9IKK2_9RHOB|nr:DUF3052 domain-containing protein [Kangsaoukella pontilimi]MXQ09662.1 DUF3052 domain-containing protein [Kangsaoukella pontilimi]